MERELWVGNYSLKAGAPLYLLGALLLVIAATINWVLTPYIRHLVFYAFIGEILVRYTGIFTLTSYAVAALGFLAILIPLILHAVNEYVVTEEAVSCRRLSLRGVKVQTLERRPDMKILQKQGLLARILNYGDVVLAYGSSTLVLQGVTSLAEVARIPSER